MQTNTRNSLRKFCNRCKKTGDHTEMLCDEPVEQFCCFCGWAHKLASQECSWRICKKCFKSHASNKYCQVLSQSYCSICDMRGHSGEFCTNNWRSFINWTDPNDLSNLKTPVLRNYKECINCGSKNHSPFQCPKLRNTLHFCNLIPSPKKVNELKLRIVTESNDLMTEEQMTIDDDSQSQIDKTEVSETECDLKAQTNLNKSVATDQQDKNENYETRTYQLSKKTKNRKKIKKKKKPKKYENASKIDKRIKSLATEFKQITMKNISNFVMHKNAKSSKSKKLTKNAKKSNRDFGRLRKLRQNRKKSAHQF